MKSRSEQNVGWFVDEIALPILTSAKAIIVNARICLLIQSGIGSVMVGPSENNLFISYNL